MGGGSETTSSGRQNTNIPSWLKPLLTLTSGNWLSSLSSTPNLGSLYANTPKLNVPDLNAGQQNSIAQLQRLGNSGAQYLGAAAKGATGGKVGGRGGTDSQLVQFLASPDETVTVTTPEQTAFLKSLGMPGFKKGGIAQQAQMNSSFGVPQFGAIQQQIQQALQGGGITPQTPYTPPYANGFGGQPVPPQAIGQPAQPAAPAPIQGGASSGQPIPSQNQPQGPAQPQGGSANGNPAGSPFPGAANIVQPTESQVQNSPGYQAAQGAINTGMGTLQNSLNQYNTANNTLNSSLGAYNTGMNSLNTGMGTLGQSSQNLQQFLGQNGPSAATTAEEGYLNSFLNPTIGSQAALMGQANGPALTEAMGQADQAALVPLLTADESNKLNATQQLAGIGSAQGGIGSAQGNIGSGIAGVGSAQGNIGAGMAGIGGQQIGAGQVFGNLGNAAGQLNLQTQQAQQGNALNQANYAQNEIANSLQASGMQYDVAQQQAQALYNQMLNQYGLGQQIQMGPANLFGNVFGGSTNSTSTTSQPKL